MTTEYLAEHTPFDFSSIIDLGSEEGAEGAGDVLHDMEDEMLKAAHFVQSLKEDQASESEMDPTMLKTIQDASKGVTEGTDAEYRR